MADAPASNAVIDFTNVKEVGVWNKKRQAEGDYLAKITKVADAPAKKDGVAQWVFTIVVGPGHYPYYIKHTEEQYWKLRNLLIACGMNVPKKKVQVNPNKLVGKTIGVTLEDDEYDGKSQSNVSATIPVSEVEDRDVPDEEEDDEDDVPAVKTKKVKPLPVEEEDDEEEEEEEPAPPPRKKKKVVVVEEEDDDDEEEEEPAPPPKKKKKAVVLEDDDDLEEIDIDDT